MSEFLHFATQAVSVVGDGKVEIPWGDWVSGGVAFFGVALAGAGTWLLRFLPAQLRWAAQVAQVDQLLNMAIQYGLNRVPGALKGKVLTVEVGSKVVEYAAEYALVHAPTIVAKFIGPLNVLKEKIIARLEVE